MRIFAQDPAFYRKARVDGTDDPEALRRLKELEAVDAIRQRLTLAEALSALGVGRSTCYEGSGSAHQPSEEPPRVCSSAAAHAAKAFLGEAAKRLDIGAVEVDGGSEFMRHSWRSGFEDEWRKRGLPLLVLPPRSP